MSGAAMGNSLDALTGKLYEKGDTRRDSGYSILYIMNNVGAIAPVITGTIAQILGYHIGFLFAAILQALGFLIYLLTEKKLYGNVGTEPDDQVSQEEKRKLIFKLVSGLGILVLLILTLFYTGIFTPTSFANTVSTIAIFIPIVYLVYIGKSKKITKEERE